MVPNSRRVTLQRTLSLTTAALTKFLSSFAGFHCSTSHLLKFNNYLFDFYLLEFNLNTTINSLKTEILKINFKLIRLIRSKHKNLQKVGYQISSLVNTEIKLNNQYFHRSQLQYSSNPTYLRLNVYSKHSLSSRHHFNNAINFLSVKFLLTTDL